jgi:hypothetical protein
MDDAASRSHPLDVSGCDHAFVSHTVAVFHISTEDISDGLDSPIRMPGESLRVISGIVLAKIIEEQKKVELRRLAETKGSVQVEASPLDGLFAFNGLADISFSCHLNPFCYTPCRTLIERSSTMSLTFSL